MHTPAPVLLILIECRPAGARHDRPGAQGPDAEEQVITIDPAENIGVEATMRDFDELAKGDLLSSMSVYLLTRPVTELASEGHAQPSLEQSLEQYEIRVLQRLNGEKKGHFKAVPYLIFQEAEKEFIGEGLTEEQALRAALRRVKGVPFNRIFPEPAP